MVLEPVPDGVGREHEAHRSAFAAIPAATTTVASPAQAVGGETIGCRISPGEADFHDPCTTQVSASTYSVAFLVQGATAGSTFTWSLSGPYVGPLGGCGSADNYCTMYVHGAGSDRRITANVTVSYAGQSVGLWTRATIPALCGPYLC